MHGPFAAAVLTGVTLTVGAAGAVASPPSWQQALTVCLEVSHALAISVQQQAAVLAEANAIWQPHGVVVREGWEDEACDRLIVVKSDVEARPEDASPQGALAWVPFVDGRPRRWCSCA